MDATALYKSAFEKSPAALASAPGRVNLMGEHTDYNDGLVLPVPLTQKTEVAVGPSPYEGLTVVSANQPDRIWRPWGEAAKGHWSDYILGTLSVFFAETGSRPQGLNMAVRSDVPMGAGLSSSASLEIAVLRAAGALYSLPLPAWSMAHWARKAENDYVGVPCGLMDQAVIALGRPGTAGLIDMRALSYEAVPLPAEARFLVIHSGLARRLSDGSYADRLAECREAAARYRLKSLRDLSLGGLSADDCGDTPARRARHVVTENIRVQHMAEALRTGDLERAGRLMLESHASQRDDYAVSRPEIDALVDKATSSGALGARLTGGGFGGAIVVLCTPGDTDRLSGVLCADEGGQTRPHLIARLGGDA